MNINSILRANPVPARHGAPMGAQNYFDPDYPVLKLQRVQMVDGDYSPDGTYWGGGGLPLWCAFNDTARVYVRASDRTSAAAAVMEECDGAEISAEYDVDAFLNAYIECALWSSTGDDAAPLDDNYGPDDISPECLANMRETCTDFIDANIEDLAGIDPEQAGHDFWLTRTGHGAGFWDRGLGDKGERLSRAAKVYRSVDLYAGDDGLIYGE